MPQSQPLTSPQWTLFGEPTLPTRFHTQEIWLPDVWLPVLLLIAVARASSSPQFSASKPCLPRAPAQLFLLLPVPRSEARTSLVPACDHPSAPRPTAASDPPSAPLLTGLSGPPSVVLPRSRRVSQSVVQPPVGHSLLLHRRLPVGPSLCCFRRLPVGPTLRRPRESAFGSTLILTSAITPLKSLSIHPSWIPMNICTHFNSKL